MATYETGLYIGHRFEKFLTKLELTSDQESNGKKMHLGVRQVLNQEYYDSESQTANSLLVGSWGKGTAIRPPRDIDVMFVLPYDVWLRYQQRSGNKQSALLQEVKAKLGKYYPHTDIRGDGQVVVVPFASYCVEVVPAFKLTSGKYWICDTHFGGSYTVTDPIAERTALDDADKASGGNTRDLIRMLKCWQGCCDVPMNSFRLELMAAAFIDQGTYRRCAPSSYPYMMQNFFCWLLDRVNWTVRVPGTGERLELGDAWETKAASAFNRATKACRFEMNGDHYDAGQEWQKIFGQFCPL